MSDDLLPGAHPLGGYSTSLALLGTAPDAPRDKKYVYQPFPPGGKYIRLLEISHGPDGQNQASYKLHALPLSECCGRFEALSYVWGDPSPEVQIEIEGKILCITFNLSYALDALRPSRNDKPRLLWIDAVCVNQEDLDERSQQVRLMRKIYESSASVPVWLGKDDTGIAQECFDLLKATATASRDLMRKYETGNNIPNPLPENPIRADRKKWALVKEMASLPWFTRVWVLQEAGLAPQATLIWGTATADFSDMIEVALLSWGGGHLFPLPDIGLFKVLDTFIDLWNTFATRTSWTTHLSRGLVKPLEDERSKTTLAEILHLGRRFSATDLRDYVFAFLGHPSALDSVTGKLLICPDYKKPLLEVYYDAACALVKETTDLGFFLSCVDRDQETLDSSFPSWVPQWHLAKNVAAIGYPAHWFFAGGKQKNAKFSISEGRRLTIRGIVLDTITWLGPATTMEDYVIDYPSEKRNSGDVMPVVDTIWRELTAQEGGFTSRYGPENKTDAFFTTLVADRMRLEDADEETANQYRRSFRAYCAKSGCRSIDPGYPEVVPQAEAWLFERDVAWAANNRRFFGTKTGWYGLGHKLAREGDVCCVFEGVRVPAVLRPVGGGFYKLIGEAYVHGVMRGEAIDMMKKGLFEEQDIVIV
ncbi:HET-domain-containing protein [Podospora fimiseda]|uniref:HET-domain-containing protein n=1 Tax=Podospora fimiseda TaxID=252190 RepID=A0AAN7BMX2_9PEZI|nr:HET-domain-containing protein [Podospora fimiseda]